ncbi:c-type cytochrome [Palleronia sediminis]|uniref:C-type cytochrome n=1 Tax=Palleronia sediminis TaxID=2547833 RepID=A0A4R6ADC9_9RHOB|nr:cytochrome c [Palleronia sediminis]TDL81197.1 c-type cytochrome [Palleronia sediminis]
MRRLLSAAALIALICVVAGLWLTRAERLPEGAVASLAGDATRGEQVFWAAGCASCHAAPDAEGEARLVLAGGEAFPSEFGTFYAPNVSMHPERGIGSWDAAAFADAVQRGVSPEGAHYYPVFPYASYALAEPQDIADLWAFWQTLPASDAENRPHDVGFPFNIRRGIGLWKRLYVHDDYAVQGPLDSDAERGRYLAEALSHCGECHTPRDALGGLDRARWFAGAPNPSGRGRIPAIDSDDLNWSRREIAQYLADGFTPDFDVAGGHMASVIANLANLPEEDRDAIAAYVQAVSPSK